MSKQNEEAKPAKPVAGGEPTITEAPAVKSQPSDTIVAGEKDNPQTPSVTPEAPKADTPFRVKRAREVFATHTVEEVYFTEDDECFVSNQFAVLHAQNLKTQVVTTVTRKETE